MFYMEGYYMKKYSAIIYDLDGTLLDTVEMNMKTLQKIIEEETGVLWPYEEVLQFVPYAGMKVMSILEFNNPKQVYQRWVKYVNNYHGGAKAFEGVDDLLSQMDGKIIQAVVSSKTREQYQIDIVTKDWDKYFSTTVLAGDTKLHKPNPEPLLLCIKQLGIKKEEAIYIGDSLLDYHCCQSAGVDFGYAAWGSIDNQGINNPKVIFSRPQDIINFIFPK